MKQLTPTILPAATVTGVSGATWKTRTTAVKELKRLVRADLRQQQGDRCWYCGLKFRESSPDIDHIAPKGIHPQWTFSPVNFVLSCKVCNQDLKKGYDPIAVVDVDYSQCSFRFVHPHLDDPSRHIKFCGHRLSILVVSLTPKGRETVSLFKLDSAERTKERAKDAFLDKEVAHLGPKARLMLEAVAYSPLSRSTAIHLNS